MSWNLPDGCTQTDIDRAAGYLDDYEPDDDDEPDEADLMETWDEDEPLPNRCRHCGEWDEVCDCCPCCGCPNGDCKYRQALSNLNCSLPETELTGDPEDFPF